MKEFDKEILNKKSYSLELLNYIEDVDFEKGLINYAEEYIKKIILKEFFEPEEKDIILLMLTFIAFKYYDGGFWPHLTEAYKHLEIDSKTIESKLRNNILSSYASIYKLNNRYSQVPVMNSLVPYNYLKDYFVFVNDIYIKNLDCNLSFYNVEEELTNIFTSIGNALSDEDDSFKYDYGNQTSKTYKLIRATKNIIKTGIKRNELIILTKEILRKIDSYYNGKNRKTYKAIDKVFNIWKKENNISKTNHKKSSSLMKSKFPFYTYNKSIQEIYLHTPIKRLYGEYDLDKFEIIIYSNDSVIYKDNNLKFNQLLGGIEIETKVYTIAHPFDKIKCIIKYKDYDIYNSQDYLYRNFLLFNEDGKEIKNNKNHNGLVYFIYENSLKGDYHSIVTNQKYKVSYSYVDETKEYILDSAYIILFSETRNSAIIGEENKDFYIFDNENKILLYNKISEICLVTKNLNPHNCKLKINDNFADNNDYEVIEQNDSLAVIFPFYENYSNGLYDIKLIDIKNEKKIVGFKFVYDNDLQTYQSQVDDYEILFSYSGSFPIVDLRGKEYSYLDLELQAINHRNYYYINVNNQRYKIKFNLNINHLIFDDYVMSFSDAINIEDVSLNSKLFFNVKDCNNVMLEINDSSIDMPIRSSNKTSYIEINTLLNYKNDSKKGIINFMNNARILETLNVFFDTVYDESSNYQVNAFKNKVVFNTYLNGLKRNETVKLRVSHKGNMLYDKEIDYFNQSNTVFLDETIRKLHYQIYRILFKHDKFKKIEYEDILHEDSISYYSFAGLLNKYLLISDITLFGEEDEDLNRKTHNLYLKLIKKIGKQSFMGYLYKKVDNTMLGFKKIDEVRIDTSNIYKENKNYFFDASIYLYYNDDEENEPEIDYLQYDVENKTVYDGIYNKYLYYIDNYKINLTLGEKINVQKKSNIQGEVYRKQI